MARKSFLISLSAFCILSFTSALVAQEPVPERKLILNQVIHVTPDNELSGIESFIVTNDSIYLTLSLDKYLYRYSLDGEPDLDFVVEIPKSDTSSGLARLSRVNGKILYSCPGKYVVIDPVAMKVLETEPQPGTFVAEMLGARSVKIHDQHQGSDSLLTIVDQSGREATVDMRPYGERNSLRDTALGIAEFNGHVYVAPQFANQVWKFSGGGELIRKITVDIPDGEERYRFNVEGMKSGGPHGNKPLLTCVNDIAADEDNLYVVSNAKDMIIFVYNKNDALSARFVYSREDAKRDGISPFNPRYVTAVRKDNATAIYMSGNVLRESVILEFVLGS